MLSMGREADKVADILEILDDTLPAGQGDPRLNAQIRGLLFACLPEADIGHLRIRNRYGAA